MVMMRKTITLPDAMDGWVKAQIESGRYGNDSEYFRDLIRQDQSRRLAERELLFLIEEGINSGTSKNTVPDIMKRVENRLKKAEQSGFTDKTAKEILSEIKAGLGINGKL